MLSSTQITAIAKKINKKIDLPLIGEKIEQKIIIFGLEKIDKVLDEQLPADFAELLDNVSEGFEPNSPDNLVAMKKYFVKYLNKKIDLPIIGEKAEKKLFSIAIDIIIEAMQKNKKL